MRILIASTKPCPDTEAANSRQSSWLSWLKTRNPFRGQRYPEGLYLGREESDRLSATARLRSAHFTLFNTMEKPFFCLGPSQSSLPPFYSNEPIQTLDAKEGLSLPLCGIRLPVENRQVGLDVKKLAQLAAFLV